VSPSRHRRSGFNRNGAHDIPYFALPRASANERWFHLALFRHSRWPSSRHAPEARSLSSHVPRWKLTRLTSPPSAGVPSLPAHIKNETPKKVRGDRRQEWRLHCDAPYYALRREIAEAARRHRVPAIYGARDFAAVGARRSDLSFARQHPNGYSRPQPTRKGHSPVSIHIFTFVWGARRIASRAPIVTRAIPLVRSAGVLFWSAPL
jgi:hypothetical protein